MIIIRNGEETTGEGGSRLAWHVADASRGDNVGHLEEIGEADHQVELKPLGRSLAETDGRGPIP